MAGWTLSGAPDGWIRAKNVWLDVVWSSRRLYSIRAKNEWLDVVWSSRRLDKTYEWVAGWLSGAPDAG
jgi:hypothetical protein